MIPTYKTGSKKEFFLAMEEHRPRRHKAYNINYAKQEADQRMLPSLKWLKSTIQG